MEAKLSRREVIGAGAATLLLRPSPAGADASCLDRLLDRRRMVRKFRPDPVGDDVVERLIDFATRAPSAGHTEPWAFVVVRDDSRRTALARAALAQMWVAEAPVVLVACADRSRPRPRYGARADRYALIDTSFASMLLLLAVVEEGLGACFVGAFDDAEVSRICGLPAEVQPLAVIPVGVPAEKPRPLPRRRVPEVRHRERW